MGKERGFSGFIKLRLRAVIYLKIRLVDNDQRRRTNECHRQRDTSLSESIKTSPHNLEVGLQLEDTCHPSNLWPNLCSFDTSNLGKQHQHLLDGQQLVVTVELWCTADAIDLLVRPSDGIKLVEVKVTIVKYRSSGW